VKEMQYVCHQACIGEIFTFVRVMDNTWGDSKYQWGAIEGSYGQGLEDRGDMTAGRRMVTVEMTCRGVQ